MIRRLAAITFVVVLTTLAASAPAASRPSRPADGPSAAQVAIESCLRSKGHLSVLFLVDESGSLSKGPNATDPEDQRVSGLRVVLNGLLHLADSPVDKGTVEVSFLGFAGDTEEVADWFTLTERSMSKAEAVADSFAKRDTKEYTNYLDAFDTARTKLAERVNQRAAKGRDGCAELFVFTDGRYLVPGGSPEIEAGMRSLCDPGGIVDQVRRLGVVTIVLSLSIASDPNASATIDGIVGSPTGAACGEDGSPRTGQHIPVLDADDLIFGGLEPTTGRYVRFDADEGLAGFHVTASLPRDDDPIILTLPDGTTERLRPGRTDTIEAADTHLSVRWPSDGTVELDGRFRGKAWRGPWELDLGSDDARSVLVLDLDVDIDLRGPEEMQIGASTPVEVELSDQHGRPLAGDLLDRLVVTGTIVAGADGTPIPTTFTREDGARWAAEADLPLDTSASTATLTVQAALPDRDDARVDPAIRSFTLPTRAPTDYPDVRPRLLDDPLVRGRRGSDHTVELPVTLVGSKVADGCVWVSVDDLGGPDGVTVATRFRGVGTSAATCRKVAKGTTEQATVEVSVDSVEDGTLAGHLRFHLRSEARPDELAVEVPVALPMSRDRATGTLLFVLAVLCAAGLVLPVLILHTINWLTAGLTPGERLRAYRAPVTIASGKVTTRDGDPLMIGDDFQAQFLRVATGNPPRWRKHRLTHGVLEFRTHPSGSVPLRVISLFRGPFASVRARDRQQIISRWVGMRRGARRWNAGRVAESPLALSGFWAFVADPPTARPDTSKPEEIRGTIAVYAAEGAARAIAHDALDDLRRNLPDLATRRIEAGADPAPSRFARLRSLLQRGGDGATAKGPSSPDRVLPERIYGPPTGGASRRPSPPSSSGGDEPPGRSGPPRSTY